MILYHIGVSPGDLPGRVLLSGSRRRVKRIADYIGGKLVDNGRQLVAIGKYKGVDLAAVDTGMGPSSASIVVREVIEAINRRGVLMRVGTCGSLQRKVEVGHLVIPSGVVIDECVSKKISGDIHPIPSDEVTKALIRSAELRGYRRGFNLHVGYIHTKDVLYEFEEPNLSSEPELVKRRHDFLERMRVLATEMEFSVILSLASRYNAEGADIRAGGILLVVSPYIKNGLVFEKPPQEDLIFVALEAISQL